MKTLMRPRLWFALLVGGIAGMVVWMLPPMPSGSARFAEARMNLLDVSSDGRFLVGVEMSHLQVWDRTHGLDRPRIDVPFSGSFSYRFSPDETHLAIISKGEESCQILLYELAEAQLVLKSAGDFDHLLFAPDGRLWAAHDRVLRDVETGEILRRLPPVFDDFIFAQNLGDFAIYRKDHEAKLYSWHSGDLVATHDLVGNLMHIHTVSNNGQVVEARGWPPGPSIIWGDFYISTNASTGLSRTFNNNSWSRRRTLSHDGIYVAQFEERTRPAWLMKWWPGYDAVSVIRIKNVANDNDVATFPRADEACFSPRSNQLAIVREHAAINIYDFPFRIPWWTIAGAALLAGAGTWSVGWLWARGRARAILPPPAQS